MMKKALVLATLFLASAPLAAFASSCETVKADIAQKIVNNGVPESGFKLEIVPNDQVSQAGGQVVGHCGFDTQKIVYTRLQNGDDSNDAAQAGSSQDTKALQ
jgi:hypothetical protein